jgi:hypothetical protein
VPILTNPDIVETYSEPVVDTLHKKNLLLLGEDRFLTTIMLRTFPRRKTMFVPSAFCKTTVPAEFKVLLSQRRRWINSTIHNLLELVLVKELCGTFCFSMNFLIFVELVGTATLPAAISFTVYISLSYNFSQIPCRDFSSRIWPNSIDSASPTCRDPRSTSYTYSYHHEASGIYLLVGSLPSSSPDLELCVTALRILAL